VERDKKEVRNMLIGIWNTIGIIIGWMVLIPLLVVVAAIIFGCFKGMIDLAIKAGDVVAAWIDEKLHKK
jgi:hypothetical protein